MRSIARACLILALLACGAWALTGCTDSTNCRKLKERFDTCSEPLWNTLEPHLRGQAPDRMAKWRSSKNDQHFAYCKRIKGRYKQSGKINACLKETDCAKFAQCFCKVVKKKGCGQP